MKVRTDSDCVAWLEQQGNGIGLVHDDFGRWAVCGSGMQNIPTEDFDSPFDLTTTYFVERGAFRPTILGAVQAAAESEDFA